MSPARVFGGHDRDVELLAQLHVRVDILLVERILEPQETQPLDGAADAHGIVVAVAPGGIEHQREVVADRPPRRLAHLDVLAGVLRRVDLVGLPAVRLEGCGLAGIGVAAVEDLARGIGADGRAIRAEQPVERDASRLGADVPQRRVARSDHAQPRDTLAGAHGGMQVLASAGVSAHQDGFEESDQRAGVGLGRAGGGTEEGVTLDAGIGVDAQQPEIAAAGGVLRSLRILGRRDVVPGEQGKLDGIDLHGHLPHSTRHPGRAERRAGTQGHRLRRSPPCGPGYCADAQIRDDRSYQSRNSAATRLIASRMLSTELA